FTFEAVKFALLHPEDRVSHYLPDKQELYLQKIEIEQGSQPSLVIPLSPDLNTLIGVRGSGKSTLLENVRFGFGLPPHDPKDYKNHIVKRFLREGNRLHLYLADQKGNTKHIIQREWGSPALVLNAEGEVQDGLLPSGRLATAYYGQKDIEELGKDFNANFVEESLLKQKLSERKEDEANCKEKIKQIYTQLQKASDYEAQKEQTKQKIAHLELEIQKFEETGWQDLVIKETNFAEDEAKIEQIGQEFQEMSTRLREVIESYGWESYLNYQSGDPDNNVFFEKELFPIIQAMIQLKQNILNSLATGKPNPNSLLNRWRQLSTTFLERKDSFKEEFRQAKQKINDPNINSEAYIRNKRNLEREKNKLNALEKNLEKTQDLQEKLETLLVELETIRSQIHQVIQEEIQKLNDLKLSFQMERK
ncbi:MAG: hypothetical protein AAFU64_16220, partial [Bacteroidota bacterium]